MYISVSMVTTALKELYMEKNIKECANNNNKNCHKNGLFFSSPLKQTEFIYGRAFERKEQKNIQHQPFTTHTHGPFNGWMFSNHNCAPCHHFIWHSSIQSNPIRSNPIFTIVHFDVQHFVVFILNMENQFVCHFFPYLIHSKQNRYLFFWLGLHKLIKVFVK